MKRLLTLCMVMVLAAIAVTGVTLAYFTAADEETNTFTVGNVDIDLIESTLHRVNAGAGRVETTDNILVSPGVDLEGNRENSPTVSDTSWKRWQYCLSFLSSAFVWMSLQSSLRVLPFSSV